MLNVIKIIIFKCYYTYSVQLRHILKLESRIKSPKINTNIPDKRYFICKTCFFFFVNLKKNNQ